MRVDSLDTGTYPVPFSWSSTCAGSSGSDALTATWQNRVFGPTSDACPTLIDLQGAGNGNISLRYFNP
jgi:hypothetical protein